MAQMIRNTRRRKTRIRKDCLFCKQKLQPDYKDVDTLKHFITDRGKIVGRIDSGVCQKHQRGLAKSIKYARFLGLLPFIVRPT